MSYMIAVAGKGGTGKSTVSAFLVRLLIEEGVRPVLAVDADPNSTLGPLLGVQPGTTIGEIREDILKEKANVTGVPKERLLEMKLEECIQESRGFDLLTMGRPEGPDCYCYVNNLLRGALTRLRSNYRAIVVDNEAGMEHLSRMNTNAIDSLVMVCEPTVVSARAAARIAVLVDSLPVAVHRRVLVWNKMKDTEAPKGPGALLAGERFDDTILLPDDDAVAQLSVQEKSVMGVAIPQRFANLLKVYAKGRLATVKG